MRFSVVVPLYNKENCIRMTLESVKKQSLKIRRFIGFSFYRRYFSDFSTYK